MNEHPDAITRRRAAAALAGLLLAPAARARRIPRAAAVPGVAAHEIVIGQDITLQGGRNAHGVAVAEGARWQFEAVNAAGGVFGRRLVLRTLDDQGSPQQAAANARQLVADGAFVLFGAIEGGPSTAVAAVAGQARVPFFGPMAGAPGLRRPYLDMVFPVRAEDRDEFRELMRYGRDRGLDTLAFVHEDSEVGRAHLATVRALAAEMGQQLLQSYALGEATDDAVLDAIAAELSAKAVGLCFNQGPIAPYARLVARVRRSRGHTLMMAVSTGAGELVHRLGPLAQGLVCTQVMPSPWERKNVVTREYRAAARRARPEADFSYGGLEGFVTAKALVMALQAAGPEPTRESLVAGLHSHRFDLGGLRTRYRDGDHEGSRFVDLAIIDPGGRFVH